ncbi:DHA2 family efflux MFS transporter permease subunit [Microtetraspora malaysiensis]|uniref:DHA2 family efflux MFS transporter permease subunit n=1 Tax=Microtetraspora malaysiensis TaxID=161358 RepID=UPI003D945AAE
MTDVTTEHTESADADRAGARAWASLFAVALGTMVLQIDGTVVAAANPAIAADLGAGPGGIQWATTAYLLVIAGLVIPAGTLADRIGLKKAFLIGVAGFSAASVVAGLSASIEMLIAGRVLQAVFAAVMSPAGIAILKAAFPPGRLPMAFGIFGSVTAVALAGGPILGGLLVEYASWPWVFFVNIPVGVAAVTLGAIAIGESARPERRPLDIPGALTLTLTMVSVVWAITGAQTNGWVSPTTIGFLALGLVLFVIFLLVERRSAHPTVPLGLFGNRSFAAGILLATLTMMVFLPIIFYLMFFLQGVQGKSPLLASVGLLPLTATFTVASPVAGWVTAKLGVRRTLLVGVVCIVVCLALLLRLDADSGVPMLAPPLVLAGFGVGFMMTPSMQAVLGNVAVDEAGVASGIQQSMQQLGSTLGVAVFGSLLTTVVGSRFDQALTGRLGDHGGAAAERIAGSEQMRQQVALGFSPAAKEELGRRLTETGMPAGRVRELADAVAGAAHQTFVDGIRTVFLVSIGVALVAGLVSLLVRDARPRHAELPEHEEAGV